MFEAFLMGVVEGLTEFLPISSTGHLILLGELIGFEGPPGKVFEITIQIGAIAAVITIFWRRLWEVAQGFWKRGTPEYFFAMNVALAFLPAAFIGAFFHSTITGLLFNPFVVACALILGGIAIIVIEKKRPEPTIHAVEQINPIAAVLIGFGQALAMIPGTSRSGATIITALLCGVDRKTAAEFSFILAIPTMIAASAYSLYKVRSELTTDGIAQIALGTVVAFVVALFTVKLLLAFIARIGFTPFGWYRIGLGTLILLALTLG